MDTVVWGRALGLLQDDLKRRDAAVRTMRAYTSDLAQLARRATARLLDSIQELFGHASVSTTQVYTRVESARLKSAYARSHPRA